MICFLVNVYNAVLPFIYLQLWESAKYYHWILIVENIKMVDANNVLLVFIYHKF